MIRFPRSLLPVLLFAAIPGQAAGLPDTGQDKCYNDTVADGVFAANLDSIARDAGTHPRQDCRYGPDAAAAAGLLAKTGAGAKGFDYTKIANNGTTLPAGALLGTANTAWACTKDNSTGLTWEVKTAAIGDRRYSGHGYTWFNSDAGTNGGNAGGVGTDTCNSTLPPLNQCNTAAYVTAVNSDALCTYTDWRMPTRRELLTLVSADGSSPSIAPTYFPNTPALDFWAGSAFAANPSFAWIVGFFDGQASFGNKALNILYVRLVRGGPL